MSRTTFTRLDSVNQAAKAGNPVAVEALLQLDKGKITVNKAYELVRKSMKKKDEKTGEEKDVLIEDERLTNARKHEKELYGILQSAVESDDMKSATMWLVFLEELKGLSGMAEMLRGKASQKAGDEIERLKKAGKTIITLD